jgi:hypothetical protein
MQEKKRISLPLKSQAGTSRLRVLSCLSLLFALTLGDVGYAYSLADRAHNSKVKAGRAKQSHRSPSRSLHGIVTMAPSRPGRTKVEGDDLNESFKPWRGKISSEEAQSVSPQTEAQPDRSFTVNLSELAGKKESVQEARIVPAPVSVSDAPRKIDEASKLDSTSPDEAQPPLTPRPPPGKENFDPQADYGLAVAPTQVIRAIDSDGFIPPDTQGAVGPNHLLSAANGTVLAQTRSGAVLRAVSLQQFVGETDAFDPRVVYDPYNNKWVLVAVARRRSAEARIMFCWSQTSDPTGNWEVRFYDVDSTNQVWADFPRVGITQDRIIVTWSAVPISGSNSSQRIWVWDSPGVYSQSDLTARGWTDQLGAYLVPAYSQDATSDIWIVCKWNPNFEGGGYLRIGKITGPFNNMTYTDKVSFARSFIWNPIDGRLNLAPQLGSAARINIGDDNVASVVYRGGQLWCAQAVLSTNSPSTSGIYFWQISPATGAVVNSRIIYGLEYWQSHPSIAVNRNNDVLIGASYFTADRYASAVYWYKAAGRDFEGQIFVGGEGGYVNLDNLSRNRWGDYSSTLVDPNDDTSFWTIQQYAQAASFQSKWGTAWAKVGGSREDGGGLTPGAPSNLVVTDINTNDLVLRWTDNSNNESGFRLETLDGTSWREFGTTTANVMAVRVTGLTPDTSYRFRVRAYNAAGPSAYSNEVSARTSLGLSAPVGLRATKIKKKAISIAWQDTASNETRYEVLQRVGASFSVVGSLGANASAAKVTGLQRQTIYTFAVRACNSGGCSSQSEVTAVTR